MFIKRDNPAQSEIIARIVENTHQIYLADLAISESVFVLTNYYRLSRIDTAEIFAALFDDPTFICSRELFSKAFNYFITHPALSFEDCCLTAAAELQHAAPLLTFDKKLAHQLMRATLATAP
jgi:predicted nucleic-acid-binding protein